jgi:hypothetical protein
MELRRGSRGPRRGSRKAEARLLVHLAPAANRGRLGLVGARGGRGGGLRGRRRRRARSRKKRATKTCLGGFRGSTRSARAGGGSGSGLVRRSQRWPWRSSVAGASPASLIKEAREEKMLSGRFRWAV